MQFLEYNDEWKTSGSKFVMEERKMVLKIAIVQHDLSHEWDTYIKLKNHRIPGILDYDCYRRYGYDRNSMQILIMNYIPERSMKFFDWRTVGIDTVRSCIKQILLTMVEGYKKCAFIHGDLHLDNVLMKKTTKKDIYYETVGIRLPVVGYQSVLMDFEFSSIEPSVASPTKFFMDFKMLFKKMYELTLTTFDAKAIQWLYNASVKAYEENAPIETVLSWLPLCDQINYSSSSVGGWYKDVYEKRSKMNLRKRYLTY